MVSEAGGSARRVTQDADRLTNTAKRATAMVKVIDLALDHAESWAQLPRPSVLTVGGNSSPEAVEEALERLRVIRMAVAATERIPVILKELDQLSADLYAMVQRLTAVVDPAKYELPTEPGCASCARSQGKAPNTIGGHWAPIFAAGLCRWCYAHSENSADRKTWPPIKACEMLHTRTAKAAYALLVIP